MKTKSKLKQSILDDLLAHVQLQVCFDTWGSPIHPFTHSEKKPHFFSFCNDDANQSFFKPSLISFISRRWSNVDFKFLRYDNDFYLWQLNFWPFFFRFISFVGSNVLSLEPPLLRLWQIPAGSPVPKKKGWRGFPIIISIWRYFSTSFSSFFFFDMNDAPFPHDARVMS